MVKLGTGRRTFFSRRSAGRWRAAMQSIAPTRFPLLVALALLATLSACRPSAEPPAPEPESEPPLLLRIQLLALEVHVASDALPEASRSEVMLTRRLQASALWSMAESAASPGEGAGQGGIRAGGQREGAQREGAQREGAQREGMADATSDAERGGRAPLPGALQARLRARVDVQRTAPARWESEVLLEVVPERRAALPAPLDAIGRGRVEGASGDAAERALERALGEAFELLEGRVIVLLGVDAEVLAALDDTRRALRISAWEEAAERRLEGGVEAARRHMEALAPPLDEEELRELLAVAGLLARLEAAEMAPLLLDRIPTRDARWLAAFLPALGRLPDPEVGRFLEVLAEGHESELVREQAAHWLGARGRGPGR